MATVIVPTVGREMHFWESGAQRKLGETNKGVQPQASKVTYVWGDRCVNLQVLSAAGVARSMTSVLVVQDGDPWDENTGPHVCWMGYQLGQARAQVREQVVE